MNEPLILLLGFPNDLAPLLFDLLVQIGETTTGVDEVLLFTKSLEVELDGFYGLFGFIAFLLFAVLLVVMGVVSRVQDIILD